MARQTNPPANTGFEIMCSGRSFLLQWKVQTEKKNYGNSVHECQKPKIVGKIDLIMQKGFSILRPLNW